MSAVERDEPFVSVEDYLAAETASACKREYVGGCVYAMSGGSQAHGVLAANLGGILYHKLRRTQCRFYGSDTTLRFRLQGADYFYYPDGMVVCAPEAFDDRFCERPSVLFEILSPSTRRTDEREKRTAYHQLPHLEAYVLIEQERAEVIVERRGERGWEGIRYAGLDATVPLGLRDLSLSMAELYEDVVFPE